MQTTSSKSNIVLEAAQNLNTFLLLCAVIIDFNDPSTPSRPNYVRIDPATGLRTRAKPKFPSPTASTPALSSRQANTSATNRRSSPTRDSPTGGFQTNDHKKDYVISNEYTTSNNTRRSSTSSQRPTQAADGRKNRRQSTQSQVGGISRRDDSSHSGFDRSDGVHRMRMSSPRLAQADRDSRRSSNSAQSRAAHDSSSVTGGNLPRKRRQSEVSGRDEFWRGENNDGFHTPRYIIICMVWK